MNNSLLTVSVITYNHFKYIAKCLDSILEQKTNFKFILRIFDDCSTDGTTEICYQYAEKYPDVIQFYPTEKNLGVIENPIRAYSNIETPYYVLVEGDDLLCDDKQFQEEFDILENHPECSFCAGGIKTHLVAEDFTFPDLFPGLNTGIYSLDYILSNPEVGIVTHTSTRMVRTSCISIDKDKPYIFLGDITQAYELLKSGKMYYVKKAYSLYNYTREGLWSGKDFFKNTRFLLDNIETYDIYTNHKIQEILVNTFKRHSDGDFNFFQIDKGRVRLGDCRSIIKAKKKHPVKKVVRFVLPPIVRYVFRIPKKTFRYLKKQREKNNG